MVKLGMIVFANHSGLANQTYNLFRMLAPTKVLIVDASGFSKNKEQDFTLYEGTESRISNGFPKDEDIAWLVTNTTTVLTCENPYNFSLFAQGLRLGIKTICQTNYEFNDNLANPSYPIPDLFLMPSHWMLEEMKEFYKGRVKYLPPPLFMEDFEENRTINIARTGRKRFLHPVGTVAFSDRNGTLSLIRAIEHTISDFELIIRSQHQLPDYYITNDPRVYYEIGSKDDYTDLYKDFDAIILPRRFGGLCLPMNEGLASGLPVIMPNCSPNNKMLPKKWLTDCSPAPKVQAKVWIDSWNINHVSLAQTISWLTGLSHDDLVEHKKLAVKIATDNFSSKNLYDKYTRLLR